MGLAYETETDSQREQKRGKVGEGWTGSLGLVHAGYKREHTHTHIYTQLSLYCIAEIKHNIVNQLYFNKI